MPAKPHRDRLIPYKLLAYLYNHSCDYIELVKPGVVRFYPGKAARALRYRHNQIIQTLEWLSTHGLIKGVRSEKWGSRIVRLKTPKNIEGLDN